MTNRNKQTNGRKHKKMPQCSHFLKKEMDFSFKEVQLWYHSCMVPQMNPVFEFNSGDNYGLDSIIEFSCGTIQLWYHNFAPFKSLSLVKVQNSFVGLC